MSSIHWLLIRLVIVVQRSEIPDSILNVTYSMFTAFCNTLLMMPACLMYETNWQASEHTRSGLSRLQGQPGAKLGAFVCTNRCINSNNIDEHQDWSVIIHNSTCFFQQCVSYKGMSVPTQLQRNVCSHTVDLVTYKANKLLQS